MATIIQKPFTPRVIYHPGVTLAEKLEELGMSAKEFSVRTKKPEKTINAVLKGNSSLTPDMAVAFESVTGIPANFWMQKQQKYNEYVARQKREKFLEESVAWSKQFPLSEMENMRTKHLRQKSSPFLAILPLVPKRHGRITISTSS